TCGAYFRPGPAPTQGHSISRNLLERCCGSRRPNIRRVIGGSSLDLSNLEGSAGSQNRAARHADTPTRAMRLIPMFQSLQQRKIPIALRDSLSFGLPSRPQSSARRVALNDLRIGRVIPENESEFACPLRARRLG